MGWAITAKTWPSALPTWRSTTQPRRETAKPAQRRGACRKVALSAVSTTRPELPPCVSSMLQVCKPYMSPDGLRASSLSPANCGCRRLDMQLRPQDRMIVCGDSLPEYWQTVLVASGPPPRNDRFWKNMMIKEPSDTSNISSCFVHLVTLMLSKCIVRVPVDAKAWNYMCLPLSYSMNISYRNDISWIQLTRTEKLLLLLFCSAFMLWNAAKICYDKYGKSGLVLQLQNDQGHKIVDRVIFGNGRSQNLLPSADCELSLLSSDLLLIFPGHSHSLSLSEPSVELPPLL